MLSDGSSGPFSQVHNGTGLTLGGAGGNWNFYMDISCVVPTGPVNVPPHIWQPIIIYLGRPR